ncbi:MAG: cob(I)yrinic acid a,c-diamide adenosyltransferase [Candidatus Anstonellales archaeon]
MTTKKLKRGITEIYYGDNDLVYYPAIGLITRALGHDFNILIIQFKENYVTNILKSIFNNEKYLFDVTKKDNLEFVYNFALEKLSSRTYDIVLLDSILDFFEELGEIKLVDLIKKRPFDVELVLTGKINELPKSIYNSAELITMVEEK